MEIMTTSSPQNFDFYVEAVAWISIYILITLFITKLFNGLEFIITKLVDPNWGRDVDENPLTLLQFKPDEQKKIELATSFLKLPHFDEIKPRKKQMKKLD
jgi:hypothetical protein